MDEKSCSDLDEDTDDQTWKDTDGCLKGRELLDLLETESKLADILPFVG